MGLSENKGKPRFIVIMFPMNTLGLFLGLHDFRQSLRLTGVRWWLALQETEMRKQESIDTSISFQKVGDDGDDEGKKNMKDFKWANWGWYFVHLCTILQRFAWWPIWLFANGRSCRSTRWSWSRMKKSRMMCKLLGAPVPGQHVAEVFQSSRANLVGSMLRSTGPCHYFCAQKLWPTATQNVELTRVLF